MRASFDGTGEVVVVTGGARGIGAALAAAAAVQPRSAVLDHRHRRPRGRGRAAAVLLSDAAGMTGSQPTRDQVFPRLADF